MPFKSSNATLSRGTIVRHQSSTNFFFCLFMLFMLQFNEQKEEKKCTSDINELFSRFLGIFQRRKKFLHLRSIIVWLNGWNWKWYLIDRMIYSDGIETEIEKFYNFQALARTKRKNFLNKFWYHLSCQKTHHNF